MQRADYRKTIDQPGLPGTGTTDRPWLLNANAAAYLTGRLAVYASYTRGLEESGIAPVNSANRNEALPAIRTRQVDGGLRWILPGGAKLVAGLFDVAKPYFNTDERDRFTVLGDVRHRGAELSLAANPTEQLSLIAGAVLMRPRVTGAAVADGRVGSRPLNQPGRTIKGNIEYRPGFAPGFSLDLAVASVGRRYASRDNAIMVPAYRLVDLGARYRFSIGKTPATVRVQMQNVGDTFAWNIVGSNSYGLMDKRRILAFVAADL